MSEEKMDVEELLDSLKRKSTEKTIETISTKKRKLKTNDEEDPTSESEIEVEEKNIQVEAESGSESEADVELETYFNKFLTNKTKTKTHYVLHTADLIGECNLLVNLVYDEVSLEGLDGITLEALWKRLKKYVEVPFLVNGKLKLVVWNIICKCEEINFFELKEERSELILNFDENDEMEATPNQIINEEEIYPHCPVNDKKEKTLGSCSTYYERTNVTNLVRTYSLEQAEEKSNKLVLVASQILRNWSLFHQISDPNIELNDLQYCLLERIGRSRKTGMMSQGKNSLQLISRDTKILFYHRKVLQQNRLVLKQFFWSETVDHNSLLHLYRFFSEYELRRMRRTKEFVNYLKEKPGHRMDYAEMRQVFGYHPSIRKIIKSQDFQKYIRTDVEFLYRDLYPDATEKEWRRKKSLIEKKKRGLELIDPNLKPASTWCDTEDKLESSDEEEEDDCEAIAANRVLLNQMYEWIFRHPERSTLAEIQRALGLGFYKARAALKALVRLKLIRMQKMDRSRQQMFKYIPVTLEYTSAEERSEILRDLTREKIINVNCVEKLRSMLVRDEEELVSNEDDSMEEEVCMEFKLNIPNGLFKNPVKPEVSINPCKFPTISLKQPTNITTTFFPHTKEEQNLLINSESLIESTENLDETKAILIEALHDYTSAMSKFRTSNDESTTFLPVDTKQTPKPSIKRLQIITIANLLGPDPVPFHTFTDDDGIRVEIFVTPEPPERQPPYTPYEPNNPQITPLFVKRANFILETLNREKIMPHVNLWRMIMSKENEEGSSMKIARRSLHRIYSTLIEGGFMRALKMVVKSEQCSKVLVLLCWIDVEAGDEMLRQFAQEVKFKYFIPKGVGGLLDEMQVRERLREKVTYKCSKTIGKTYGYTTKFLRMQILHEFIFYLFNELRNRGPASEEELEMLWERGDILKEDLEGIPTVYNASEVGWKMFVPPLIDREALESGWIIYSDLLLRLPLSIFVKIFSVNYVVPGLKDYLKHRVKKHILVKYLPEDIRTVIMHKRICVHSIYTILCNLCFIGLARMHPGKPQEKETCYIRLNTKAMLLDTTISAPGYHQIEPNTYMELLYFDLRTIKDVEDYWYRFFNICMKTPLGRRTAVAGKPIVIENAYGKKYLTKYLRSVKKIEDDEEEACLPGDRLGAAGTDSSLWAHLKRNWIPEKFGSTSKPTATNVVKKKVEAVKKRRKIPVVKDDAKKLLVKMNWKKFGRSKKKVTLVRVLKKPERRIRKMYYDKTDLEILKNARGNRSDWNNSEDQILSLTKLAIDYLCPNAKQLTVSSVIVRDAFNCLLADNRKKTAKACQRRTRHLIGNQELLARQKAALNKLNKDRLLESYFGSLRRRIATNSKQVKHKELNTAFFYIFNYLLKQSDILATSVDLLTEETIRNYKPETTEISNIYKDPTTKDEILSDTAISVVHSALGSESHASLAYQLLKVYKSFPQQILMASLTKLRNQQFLSVKSFHQKRKSKQEFLYSTPFRFSANYCFTQWLDFPWSYFQSSLELMRDLQTYIEPKEIKSIKQGAELGLAEVSTTFQTTYRLKMPEETVNPEIKDRDKFLKRLAAQYKSYIAKKYESMPEMQVEDVIEEMLKDDGVGERRVPYYTEIADLLLSGKMRDVDGDDGSGQDKFIDAHLLLNLPVPVLDFVGRVEFDRYLEGCLRESRVEKFVAMIERDFVLGKGCSHSDCKGSDELLEFIVGKRELGANIHDIKNKFQDTNPKDLIETLNNLEEQNIIFKTGVVTITYVHSYFKEPWIVRTYSLAKTQQSSTSQELELHENVESAIRVFPWVMANGVINRQVLINWLVILVSFCMRHPESPISRLIKKFLYLKPTDIYRLLMYLQDMECLELVSYKSTKVNLCTEYVFSKPEPSLIFDSYQEMCVKVNPNVVSKLSSFLYRYKNCT